MPTPQDRIAHLLPIYQGLVLDDDTEFIYSWQGGYEKLTYRNSHNEGEFTFEGAYHPNVVCEGNPCAFCGKAYNV